MLKTKHCVHANTSKASFIYACIKMTACPRAVVLRNGCAKKKPLYLLENGRTERIFSIRLFEHVGTDPSSSGGASFKKSTTCFLTFATSVVTAYFCSDSESESVIFRSKSEELIIISVHASISSE